MYTGLSLVIKSVYWPIIGQILYSYLPCWSFSDSFVPSIISSVREELAGQLVRVPVHAVYPEPDLVDSLDLAGLLSALHQADNCAAILVRILGIGRFQLYEALWIFGIVLEISLLNAACVGANLPAAIEDCLFVCFLIYVAKVDGVEVT